MTYTHPEPIRYPLSLPLPMFLSTQLCPAPPCLHIISIPFFSHYRLYFLHWYRHTLARFFLCYLYPLFWAYLLLPRLYNFHCSWPSLYPVDPFPDFSAFCFSLHSFTIVRHSSLSLVVISCAIEIFLYFSSAYPSLDKDFITSFLVVLSRNSINNGLAVPISVAFPTLKILFMSLLSLFIFRTSLNKKSTCFRSSAIPCSTVIPSFSSSLWIMMLLILSSLLLSSSAVSLIFTSTSLILSLTTFISFSTVLFTIVVHFSSISPLFPIPSPMPMLFSLSSNF